MPTVSSIEKEIAGHHSKIAQAKKEQNKHEAGEAKARASADSYADRASRASSPSIAKAHRDSARREVEKAVKAGKAAAGAAKDQANIRKQLASSAAKLESARKDEQRADNGRARKEKTEQQRADREADSRRRKEKDHARDLARIRPEIRHVYLKPPKPEPLRVLYLTASPLKEKHLRVDAEVNNVLKAIRGASHRDHFKLEVRPAATAQDLMDGINDVRPHVVHFSGHGDTGVLVFDNASLDNPEGRKMNFDTLAEMLAATGDPPKMLVMNACDTLDGADRLLKAVPIVIAMAASVGDAAAGVFATQFYAAIASAQPIGAALRQGRVMMKNALHSVDADLPTCVVRDDIDIDDTRLIERGAS